MAALVTVEEFSTFLGIVPPVTGSIKLAQMQQFLDDTSEWAREISGKAWVLPADAPATVRGIIKASARREWNNPKRVSYLVKGPQTATFPQAAYPTEFFTDAEEAKLLSYKVGGGGLFTLQTTRDLPEETWGYLQVTPNGGFMPCYDPCDEVGWPTSYHF